MNIEAVIKYQGHSVATFDPEKVLLRIIEHFPDAVIDPTDWAQREVAALDSFLDQRSIAPETKQTMSSQIRGKARRNGPVFKFRLADSDLGTAIEGYASRYRVGFRSAHDIEQTCRRRITDFLRSLELGDLLEK